jgi:hypothetical protein
VALKVARWGLSWEAACDNVAQVTLFFFFLSFLLSLFSFIFTVILSKACYFVFKISEQPNTSKQNTNGKKFQNFHSLSLSFPEPKISEQPNTSKQNTNCNSLQSLLFCFWLENCDPNLKFKPFKMQTNTNSPNGFVPWRSWIKERALKRTYKEKTRKWASLCLSLPLLYSL